jgi:protein arginine kinase
MGGGFNAVSLASLAPRLRDALVEAAIFPRSYTLDPANLLICSDASPSYILLDETDHLRAHARLGGLRLREAVEVAAVTLDSCALPLGPFAFDEEFGFLTSRLEDSGSGLELSALVHVPALSFAGLADRAIRGVLARGLVVRGFYGSDEGSVGDLYELSTDHAFGASPGSLTAEFEAALTGLVHAERHAREELASRRREELTDRAGRALGLIRYCRVLGESEAAAQLSALRLGVLAGVAAGLSPASLGRLIVSLGPGMLAVANNETATVANNETATVATLDVPGVDPAQATARKDRWNEERLRALVVASALSDAYIVGGGESCSKA